MDWSKVDAALAGALADTGDPGDPGDPAERRLPVFVHLEADRADPSLLAQLDLHGAAAAGVRTGTLSASELERLTDQSWVTRVHLSGPLRLLGGG